MERQEIQPPPPPTPRGRLEDELAVQGRRRLDDGVRIVAAALLIRAASKAARDPRPWKKEEGNIIGALNLSCATAAFGLAGASLVAVLFAPRWETSTSSSRKAITCLLLWSLFLITCCLGMTSAEEPLHMFFISLGVWVSAGTAALFALGKLEAAVAATRPWLTALASRLQVSNKATE